MQPLRKRSHVTKKSLWHADAVQSNDALHQVDRRRHRRRSEENHSGSDREKGQDETHGFHDADIALPIPPQPGRDQAPAMIDRKIETMEQAPNDKYITGTEPKSGEEHLY